LNITSHQNILRKYIGNCYFKGAKEMSMYKDYETPLFWKTYSEALRKYLEKRMEDKSLVDDILHDVYLKVFLYCKRFDFCCEKAGVKNLRSWIFQVCHNSMLDKLKSNAKYSLAGDVNIELAENYIDSQHVSINAKELIAKLPQKYAEAIYLDTVLNIIQQDIATKLGLGISTTKSRIQRGKRMLKEIYLQQIEKL
jgi:RNA polymerase sigma-70 factor (ECF subfamily)